MSTAEIKTELDKVQAKVQQTSSDAEFAYFVKRLEYIEKLKIQIRDIGAKTSRETPMDEYTSEDMKKRKESIAKLKKQIDESPHKDLIDNLPTPSELVQKLRSEQINQEEYDSLCKFITLGQIYFREKSALGWTFSYAEQERSLRASLAADKLTAGLKAELKQIEEGYSSPMLLQYTSASTGTKTPDSVSDASKPSKPGAGHKA